MYNSAMMKQALTGPYIEQITSTINSTLGYFVQAYTYSQAAFPILPNSYTLWRRLAYHHLTLLPCYSTHTSQLHFNLYLLSECGLLPKFIALLKQHQPTPASSSSQHPQQSLIEQYQAIVWMHSLYKDLFMDLVRLPYLRQHFKEEKQYRLRHCYDLNQQIGEEGEKGASSIPSKVGQGILKKGVGSLAEKVFTRTVLFKASSLAIRLNPVAMATSYAFSQLLQYLKKQRKEEYLMAELQEAICRGRQVVEALQEGYQECMGWLGGLLKGDGNSEEQFLRRVGGIVEEDWLQVTTMPSEDGWDIVVLEQKQSAIQTLR